MVNWNIELSEPSQCFVQSPLIHFLMYTLHFFIQWCINKLVHFDYRRKTNRSKKILKMLNHLTIYRRIMDSAIVINWKLCDMSLNQKLKFSVRMARKLKMIYRIWALKFKRWKWQKIQYFPVFTLLASKIVLHAL